jgi:hypothetical protein
VVTSRPGSLTEVRNEYLTLDVELDVALAALQHLSGRALARLLGVDRRTVDRLRAGALPRRGLRERLVEVASRIRAEAYRPLGKAPIDGET